MHRVISMNLQWKIIFSTCLAIAICFAVASAATETPFTKNSFDKPSTTSFAEAKAAAAANFRTDWTSFDSEPSEDPEGIQEPDPTDTSVDLTLPAITRPFIIPTPFPTRTFPLPLPTRVVPGAITESEALEIAGTHGITDNPLCPGITATREILRIDGSLMGVWSVSGRCGKIVYLDMYSGDLVRTDYRGCMCYDSSTRRA